MSIQGEKFCPKCNDTFYTIMKQYYRYIRYPMGSMYLITILNLNRTITTIKTPKIPGIKRIGPHNKEILSIIYGSLLGDGTAEQQKNGNGTRICFYQEAKNVNYLLQLHNLISNLGYCNHKLPEIQTRLGLHGKIRKIIRFKTHIYSSQNYIRELQYKNNIKILPKDIDFYLTPLALAIQIMDDGTKLGLGMKLCTNNFSKSEVLYLVNLLNSKYNLITSIQIANRNKNQYHIYISKHSIPLLQSIVGKYIHSSMKYKFPLNKYD